VQTGRGVAMNELTADETEACLTELVELQNDFEPMLVRAKCAPQYKQISWSMGRGGLESGGCMAGTEYCRITPDGYVTPCPYMDVIAGDVRAEGGFTGVWSDSKVLNELRLSSMLKGRCGACEFRDLCGGCRCRAYAGSGDYLAEDPACTYRPGSLDAPVTVENVSFSDPVLRRMERIPITFIRDKVRKGLLAYAARHNLRVVTMDDMDKAMSGASKRFSQFQSSSSPTTQWKQSSTRKS